MSNSLCLVAKGTHPELGYCMALNDHFVTMITKNPPAADSALVYLQHGWEVYYLPVPYRWVALDPSIDSWITTYRRIPNVQVQY